MNARRGEVPFVAVRVGRGQDPREVLGLADDLKIAPAHALGFVTLWEEFVLEVGDALSGRVVGYSVKHLAVKLGWRGNLRRLSDALREAGLLLIKRNTLIHPYWRESVTGQYARQRAEQREADRLRKRRARNRTGDPAVSGADASGDVTRTSGGQLRDSGGGRADSSGNPEINQPTNGAHGAPGAGPPPGPPETGGSLGAARWEWIKKNHRRPMNSKACARYLELLTVDDWDLCRWVVALPARGLAGSSSRKKRVLGLDSHRFLATEAYLQFSPEWREKQAADSAPRPPKRSASVEQVSDEDRRWTSAIAFVLAQLADNDLTDGEKDEIRAKWRERWPDKAPPWERGPDAAPVQEVA
jgi:hypothetical protein